MKKQPFTRKDDRQGCQRQDYDEHICSCLDREKSAEDARTDHDASAH